MALENLGYQIDTYSSRSSSDSDGEPQNADIMDEAFSLKGNKIRRYIFVRRRHKSHYNDHGIIEFRSSTFLMSLLIQ